MGNLLFEDESYGIRGAIYNVYRELGGGFLEAVYQEALEREFRYLEIPFVEQPELKIFYRGAALTQIYIPDFICFDKIIIELKAVKKLSDENTAQVHNYLKATGLHVGLLVNFGHYPKAEIHRIVL